MAFKQSIDYMLRVFQLYSPDEISFLVDLLNWVLTNNYLEYDNQIYLQISGTAMGTPVAVAYSNLVLCFLEDHFLNKIPQCYYKRYIDDIFAIVKSKEDENRLIDLFNSQCPSIQLEGSTVDKHGIFLDIDITITESNAIITKIYQKPSNKYLYIPPSSAHSKQLLHKVIQQEINR
jgi:hypothetical protein